ncbi:hypothetical protein GCM10027299_12850 [Larkinella ripae]
MKSYLLFGTLLFLADLVHAQQNDKYHEITQNILEGKTSVKQVNDFLIATNTIYIGGSAYYKAGQAITLKPGFAARKGANLRATIAAPSLLLGFEKVNSLTVEAFPLPFSDAITIEYYLPAAITTRHIITDISGKVFKSWVSEKPEITGAHKIRVEADSWSQGIYFYQIISEMGSKTIRLLK